MLWGRPWHLGQKRRRAQIDVLGQHELCAEFTHGSLPRPYTFSSH